MDNPYCNHCDQEHGPLYVCPHYSSERQAAIAEKAAIWKAQLENEDYMREQLEEGDDGSGLMIQCCFAGADSSALIKVLKERRDGG